MKFWMITLILLALAAAVIGFSGLAGAASGLAKVVVGVFVVGVTVAIGVRSRNGGNSSGGETPRDRRPPSDGEAGSVATATAHR
jgi:uncharacterized membrane protein YtjA (UPF0391 family)